MVNSSKLRDQQMVCNVWVIRIPSTWDCCLILMCVKLYDGENKDIGRYE